MWRTPRGERTLRGSEAALLREVLGHVYDEIDITCRLAEMTYVAGVPVFDRLQPSQQLFLLAEVGCGLLRDVRPPELTAIREATIAALFAQLRGGVAMEIDEEIESDSFSWRKLVHAAYVERHPDDQNDVPSPSSTDFQAWDELIEVLADGMLWDADWEMEDLFIDDAPEKSNLMKSMMRISDNYFTDVPVDPTDEQLGSVRTVLNELTGCQHNI